MHFLDWENRPNPFKEYLRLEPRPLPPHPPELEVGAADALAAPAPSALTLESSSKRTA